MSAGSGRIIRTIIAQENCPAMPHGCWYATAWAVHAAQGSQPERVRCDRALLSGAVCFQVPARRRGRPFLKKEPAQRQPLCVPEALREESLAGMGTTAVCALVRGGKVFLCHAGDSRAYLYRDGRLASSPTTTPMCRSWWTVAPLPWRKPSTTLRRTSSPRRWAWTTGWTRSSPPHRCRKGYPAAVLGRPDQCRAQRTAGTAAAHRQVLRPAGPSDPHGQRERRPG